MGKGRMKSKVDLHFVLIDRDGKDVLIHFVGFCKDPKGFREKLCRGGLKGRNG